MNEKPTAGDKCICIEDNKMTQALCPVHRASAYRQDKAEWDALREEWMKTDLAKDYKAFAFAAYGWWLDKLIAIEATAREQEKKESTHLIQQAIEESRVVTLREAMAVVPEKWERLQTTQGEVSYEIGYNECREKMLEALTALADKTKDQ